MLHSRSELEYFHQLLKLDFPYQLTPGLRIGRGFADVGYEEYSVLVGNQAVSLSTGKKIILDEFYQNYYFPILSVDQIVKEVYSRGWNIINCTFENQRSWLFVIQQEGRTIESEQNSLLIACIKTLLQILNRN